MRNFNIQDEKERIKRFFEKEEKNKRAKRIFGSIEIVLLMLTISLCSYNLRLAIISLVWLVANAYAYRQAGKRFCMGDSSKFDPAFGLEVMFDCWKILCPLIAAAVVLVLANHQIVVTVYGLAALLILYIYRNNILFNTKTYLI